MSVYDYIVEALKIKSGGSTLRSKASVDRENMLSDMYEKLCDKYDVQETIIMSVVEYDDAPNNKYFLVIAGYSYGYAAKLYDSEKDDFVDFSTIIEYTPELYVKFFDVSAAEDNISKIIGKKLDWYRGKDDGGNLVPNHNPLHERSKYGLGTYKLNEVKNAKEFAEFLADELGGKSWSVYMTPRRGMSNEYIFSFKFMSNPYKVRLSDGVYSYQSWSGKSSKKPGYTIVVLNKEDKAEFMFATCWSYTFKYEYSKNSEKYYDYQTETSTNAITVADVAEEIKYMAHRSIRSEKRKKKNG